MNLIFIFVSVPLKFSGLAFSFEKYAARFFIKILSWELQLYQLIISQPICNNGLTQCNYNPNIWNTFDYWNEIVYKS